MLDDFSMLTGLPQGQQEALLQQMVGMGTLDERQALLAQQLAQAEALRNRQGPQRTTGVGAALQGLGDVASNLAGTLQGRDVRGKMEDLLGKKDAGRQEFVRSLLRAQELLRQQQQGGMGFVPPPPPATY